MPDKAGLIHLRNYDAERDEAFVCSTFLRNLYYSSTFWKQCRKDKFMEFYHVFIERLLSKPTTETVILCLNDDDDVIIGYSIITPENVLHFVYVKRDWRRNGFSNLLVPNTIKIITHLTDLGDTIYRKKRHLEFDPFFAWK